MGFALHEFGDHFVIVLIQNPWPASSCAGLLSPLIWGPRLLTRSRTAILARIPKEIEWVGTRFIVATPCFRSLAVSKNAARLGSRSREAGRMAEPLNS